MFDTFHIHLVDSAKVLAAIADLKETLMATNAELNASLTAIADQLDKASTELVAEIQTLTNAVAAAGGSTPEVDASVQRLQALAQRLDDMNADAAQE